MGDLRDARADVKADKARAKALRPWYKKKRFVIPLVLLVFIVLIASMGGDEEGGEAGRESGGDQVVQVQIPGEATLSTGDKKSITRFADVTTATSAGQFNQAGAGNVFLTFKGEVENVSEEGDIDLNPLYYRLKMPSGEIVDYQFEGMLADGDNGFGSGVTLPPGVKKAVQLTWKVPTPTAGQTFVVYWKPSHVYEDQAQFTYTHE